MSLIQSIELFHVKNPLPASISPAAVRGKLWEHQNLVVARFTTDDGLQGITATQSIGQEHTALQPWLAEAFLGQNAYDMNNIRQQLWHFYYRGWQQPWLEAAFWDLRGKRDNTPLYQMLSPELGEVDELTLYASPLQVTTPDESVLLVESCLQAGFQAVKLRLSGSMVRDFDTLTQVRQKLGGDFGLMVDLQQGRRSWVRGHEPERWKLIQALDFVDAARHFKIEWLEDPMDMHAYDDHSVLCSESPIPVAGGQGNAGWQEYKIFFEKEALDIFQPNPLTSGGVTIAAQVLDACYRRDLHYTPQVDPHGISMALGIHLCAAWHRPFFLEFPYEPGDFEPNTRDSLLTTTFNSTLRGTVEVPQGPGLGIELNEAFLAEHGTLLFRLDND